MAPIARYDVHDTGGKALMAIRGRRNLNMADLQLANLVNMSSPQAVLDEAVAVLEPVFAQVDTMAVRLAFNQMVSLYQGDWEGTRGCNTDYHDLKHVTDCFLAMVRLLHGAAVTGIQFSSRQIHQVLVAALLHDVGYLQNTEDTEGTGAKYTAYHVRRSMDFVQRHFVAFGLMENEVHDCLAMIHCTDLTCEPASIPFGDGTTEQIGKMLATADIMAQMADRTYLEKLLFLFYEMEEARIGDFGDEVDLLHRSKDFYRHMADRFERQLSSVNRFMIHHFRARWNIDVDLYQLAIDNQRNYLSTILTIADEDPRSRLRRSRIVEMLNSKRA
ncbi:MAG: hypothetical protein PVG51_03250 [Desulfosarcina sp.]